eukprot:1161802-Pelagomonas_calceolata.AAC.17
MRVLGFGLKSRSYPQRGSAPGAPSQAWSTPMKTVCAQGTAQLFSSTQWLPHKWPCAWHSVGSYGMTA